jgi:hypothetical protein
MNEAEYAKQQYLSLRSEILQSKEHMFRLASIGSPAVPAAGALIDSLELDAAFLALPLLVVVIGILFVSENQAIMRCGRYIREQIESRYATDGWERWLEKELENSPSRAADKWLHYAFFGVFVAYYVGSAYFGTSFVHGEVGAGFRAESTVATAISYAVFGLMSVWFMAQNLRASTRAPTPNRFSIHLVVFAWILRRPVGERETAQIQR